MQQLVHWLALQVKQAGPVLFHSLGSAGESGDVLVFGGRRAWCSMLCALFMLAGRRWSWCGRLNLSLRQKLVIWGHMAPRYAKRKARDMLQTQLERLVMPVQKVVASQPARGMLTRYSLRIHTGSETNCWTIRTLAASSFCGP
jgi:hypothetical protein